MGERFLGGAGKLAARTRMQFRTKRFTVDELASRYSGHADTLTARDLLKVRRLNHNPYESPVATTAVSQPRRSRRIYWVASIAVVTSWVLVLAAMFCFTNPTIQNGEVWIHIPGEVVSVTPSGDSMILDNRMISTTILGAATFLGVTFAMSLACVNGLIAFTRYRGRQILN